MGRTGMLPKCKCSTLKQQRENAELEAIIEEFGRAMRNAYRPYIAGGGRQYCCHTVRPFTPGMRMTFDRYVEFCMKHPNE